MNEMTASDNNIPSYDTVKSIVDDREFLIPRPIGAEHLKNCRVVADRFEGLNQLPKRGKIAELGVQKGLFSKSILKTSGPTELHLFDLSFSYENFPFDHEFFVDYIKRGTVTLHEGDSSSLLAQLPDEYFDWIYIDGDHTLEGARKDADVAKTKIKSDGYLVFNDYTIFSPLENMHYGVPHIVNDLCLDDGFEMIYFALNTIGYHDVCIQRRG